MTEIDALQSRITAALDRIAQGLERAGGAPDPSQADALRRALDDERSARAEMDERLKALQARLSAAEETAEAARREAQRKAQEAQAVQQEARGQLARLDRDLQSLRKANQQLRDSNRTLREANAAGLAEPGLIDAAMLAELEGLRAARIADRAEVDAVLDEMARLLGDAPGAARNAKEEA